MSEVSSSGAKVGPSQPARLVTRQSRRKSSAPYSRPASSPGGKTGLTTYLEETSLEWSEKAAVTAAVSHTPRGNMLTAELQRDPSQGFGMILNSNNRVTQIISGSPADKAGVHVFDLVVKVERFPSRFPSRFPRRFPSRFPSRFPQQISQEISQQISPQISKQISQQISQ